jgi:hypothetical protein
MSHARSIWRCVAVLCALALLVLPGEALRAGPTNQSTLTGAVDHPSGDVPVHGVVEVEGWAVDQVSHGDPGVERVSLLLDGVAVTEAQLGLPRADIARAFGAGFADAGWRAVLDLDTLVSRGPHTLEVRVSSRHGSAPLVWRRALQVEGPARFCVNTHLLWFDPAAAARDLDRVRLNGLTSVRFDVAWDRLEPDARGRFDADYLARLEIALDMATARGLQSIVTVLGTPGWARGHAGSLMTPPHDPADYGHALGYLAGRLAARRRLAYEIWNEPNQVTFWSMPTGPDADVYTAMLREAYASIKAVAPGAVVLGGSLAFNDRAYLQAMFAAGAAGSFDALAIHPYSLDYDPDSSAEPTRSFRMAIEDALESGS